METFTLIVISFLKLQVLVLKLSCLFATLPEVPYRNSVNALLLVVSIRSRNSNVSQESRHLGSENNLQECKPHLTGQRLDFELWVTDLRSTDAVSVPAYDARLSTNITNIRSSVAPFCALI